MGLRERRTGKPRNKHDEKWNARFKELLDYRSEHGDCDVPRQGKLGTWVNNQRKVFMADSLAQDRIDRLNSIGFNWAPQKLESEGLWNTRFSELVEYKAKHGDCNVPSRQGKLGRWVNKQRMKYMAGSLSQDGIDRLNSIGFKWSLKGKRTPWETRFNELVQYKAKHGDCNVPVMSQGQLGYWVDTQRKLYRKDKLSQERIDCLSGIGFNWTPPRGGSRKRKAPNETEDDDDIDEIGALIYDQVTRQRQPCNFTGRKAFPSRQSKSRLKKKTRG